MECPVLQTNDDKIYQIIDGCQRLATLCTLILAVIDYLRKYTGIEDEKEINEQRAFLMHSTTFSLRLYLF